MKYSNIGYVPLERRFINDPDITRSALKIFCFLRSCSEWKNGFKELKACKRGVGYFSQHKLACHLGWSTRTIRWALTELESKGLIWWEADDQGTRFRILVEPRQNNAVWLDHNDPHIKSRSHFKQYSYLNHSKKSSQRPQKRVLKTMGTTFINGIEVPVVGYT